MLIDLSSEFDSLLSEGGDFTEEETDSIFSPFYEPIPGMIETRFGEAGFYSRNAKPYAPPTRARGEEPTVGAEVNAERQLWLVRFNPNELDVDDPVHFDWWHPEAAPTRGWLVDSEWSKAGNALKAICPGDLVVVQRSDPGPDFTGNRKTQEDIGGTVLLGLAAVLHVRAFRDIEVGRIRRSACLMPLTRFTHPVLTRYAKTRGRLVGASFAEPRQQPGRKGGLSLHLSAVDGDDIVDLLSVCGICPEVLAEPDVAIIGARLGATQTGNKEYLDLMYDHVIANNERRRNEREATQAAKEWADAHEYSYLGSDEGVALAGYDLLFADKSGGLLEVEVKGYTSKALRDVHLQPSQYLRAERCAAGNPPKWRLFVLLGAGSAQPSTELVLKPDEALDRVHRGQLQVKGGSEAIEKLRRSMASQQFPTA